MTAQKTIYWIATGLLSALFLYSAVMYLTDTAVIEGYYQDYQYPTYLVIPMALAKILAILFILLRIGYLNWLCIKKIGFDRIPISVLFDAKTTRMLVLCDCPCLYDYFDVLHRKAIAGKCYR